MEGGREVPGEEGERRGRASELSESQHWGSGTLRRKSPSPLADCDLRYSWAVGFQLPQRVGRLLARSRLPCVIKNEMWCGRNM